MADEGFNQLRLPKLAGVAFSDMTLYRKKRNAAVVIEKPVFCLIGANGLGKSTFLNTIIYAVTGAIPDPDRAFQSAREYFADASKPEKVRDYFGGRLSEADRPLASIKVLLAWPSTDPARHGTDEVEIIRPLADGTAVSQLVERSGGTENVLSGPEADARYRKLIIDRTGIGDFAQFAFLMHFVLMFDEARHLLMWDDRVLTNALYLAFGVGADAVEQSSAKTRAMEREASLSRNVRYAAKVVSDRKTQLADLLSNNASTTTTDDIELKARFDRLVAAVDHSIKFVTDKDRELRAAEVELADAASRVTDLQISYRQVFSERLAGRANARFQPVIEETLRTNSCAVCGAAEARSRVQVKLDASQCPLCDAVVVADDGDDGLLAELRRIDERLTSERGKVENVGARRERLKRERAGAEGIEAQARDALAAFEADHANVANLSDPRDATMVKEEMDRLDTEYGALVRRSEDHRRARDRIREELRDIEKGLQDRYERASTKFVPRFRALAEEFIGLPIDIELEQRRGVEIAGFGLRMKMDDKLRLSADRLSESQRFFLDIALRMALSEFMSPAGSTMLIDTPEGSLDIAYEARAGNMFDSYSRAGNDILMTANLRSSKLIERLAQTSTRERMQVVKMTEWADLSAVQLAEESLFDDEYRAIEKGAGVSMEEMDEIVPQAFYDCLLMIVAAPRSVAPLSSMELHLFAYLACAISVFQGHPAGDWGYAFTLVGTGRPFSPAVDRAERIVLARNLAGRDDEGLLHAHQPAARNEVELLSRFGFVGDRQTWGRTAVECALALPVGAIRQAMLARPGVSQAVELHQLRALMSADDVARIHREREEVVTLVGETADLLAPAVAWLTLSLNAESATC